jgi:uncharacterized protein
MSRKMFVNLPVADLPKAKAFFEAIGFRFNAQFSDDTAACMVISDENYAMLLTHAKFLDFTKRPLPDTRATTGVLVAVSLESKAEVDAMLKAALAAGGTEPVPAQDHGFMYARTIADLDGHRWEPFWMDPSFVHPSQEERT